MIRSSGFLFIWSLVVIFGHIVFIYVQFRSNGPVSLIFVAKLVFSEDLNYGFRRVENRANCKLSVIRMVRRQNQDALLRSRLVLFRMPSCNFTIKYTVICIHTIRDIATVK